VKRKYALFCATLLIAFSAHAHGVFIPIYIQQNGHGKPGNLCASGTSKVGDKKTNASGDTITITALSGHSARCSNTATPILALAEFTKSATFSAQAGINLPEGYAPIPLTALDRFHGVLIRVTNKKGDVTVELLATRRDRWPNLDSAANQLKAQRTSTLKDPKASDTETLVINGLQARRFAVDGRSGGAFSERHTYLITIMDGAQEAVAVVAWAPSKGYDKSRSTLESFAGDIVGINEPPQANSEADSAPPVSEIR
jgi:hypothetical protein